MSKPLPLAHITVLDLTRARAGPTAVRQLADWGANVIKIEAPGGPGSGEALGGWYYSSCGNTGAYFKSDSMR